MSDEWVFYGRDSLNVESYDSQAQAGQPVLGGDVEFYIDQARARGPVLDLGGGTGRVAWPLAEAGFEVTSLDLSAPMLARSEAKRALASPAAQARVKLSTQTCATSRCQPSSGSSSLLAEPSRCC